MNYVMNDVLFSCCIGRFTISFGIDSFLKKRKICTVNARFWNLVKISSPKTVLNAEIIRVTLLHDLYPVPIIHVVESHVRILNNVDEFYIRYMYCISSHEYLLYR